MTPDEATICAGRMFQMWADHPIEFDVWETTFAPFDYERTQRALDKLRGATAITPTVVHVLATYNGTLPSRSTHPPVEHISHTDYLNRLRTRAGQGDHAAIEQLATFDRLEQNRQNAANRRPNRKIAS